MDEPLEKIVDFDFDIGLGSNWTLTEEEMVCILNLQILPSLITKERKSSWGKIEAVCYGSEIKISRYRLIGSLPDAYGNDDSSIFVELTSEGKGKARLLLPKGMSENNLKAYVSENAYPSSIFFVDSLAKKEPEQPDNEQPELVVEYNHVAQADESFFCMGICITKLELPYDEKLLSNYVQALGVVLGVKFDEPKFSRNRDPKSKSFDVEADGAPDDFYDESTTGYRYTTNFPTCDKRYKLWMTDSCCSIGVKNGMHKLGDDPYDLDQQIKDVFNGIFGDYVEPGDG